MRHERRQMKAGVDRLADRVVVDWRKLGHSPQIVIHFVMISVVVVVVVPGVPAIGQHFKSLFISWHNVIDYVTSPPYAILLQPSALNETITQSASTFNQQSHPHSPLWNRQSHAGWCSAERCADRRQQNLRPTALSGWNAQMLDVCCGTQCSKTDMAE